MVCGSSTSAELCAVRMGLETLVGFCLLEFEIKNGIPMGIKEDDEKLLREIISETGGELRSDSNNNITKFENK